MSRYSREAKVNTIASGDRHTFEVRADWFFVHKLQVVNESGADAEIELSVNGRAMAPISPGEPGSAVQLGIGEIQTLEFHNTSGAAVFVRVIYGLGGRPNSPLTKLTGQVDLTPASITALLNPQSLKAVCEQIPAGGVARVYSGFKSIEIVAIQAAGTPGVATITSPSGLNFPIPTGDGEEFSCENDNDHIEDITVTPDANTIAQVTGLKI